MKPFKASLLVFLFRLVIFKYFLQFREDFQVILDACRHDFAEAELDVLFVLILFGLHDELVEELESILALIDTRVLDRDL